jgi:transposase
MERRRFTREFKVEAVKLVRERGVAVKQAARDLNVHENLLRKWVKDFAADPQQAFPGHGQMKPEQLEIERLRILSTDNSQKHVQWLQVGHYGQLSRMLLDLAQEFG